MSLRKNKIGLLSWISNQKVPSTHSDTYLNLGEINDNNIKNNVYFLLFLTSTLRYLYPFKGNIKKNKVFIINL